LTALCEAVASVGDSTLPTPASPPPSFLALPRLWGGQGAGASVRASDAVDVEGPPAGARGSLRAWLLPPTSAAVLSEASWESSAAAVALPTLERILRAYPTIAGVVVNDLVTFASHPVSVFAALLPAPLPIPCPCCPQRESNFPIPVSRPCVPPPPSALPVPPLCACVRCHPIRLLVRHLLQSYPPSFG
jgi:hypothetical protein